jgi:hypothetical protein
MAIDADDHVLEQLRQEGFELDEYDLSFNVKAEFRRRFDSLVNAERTFYLVSQSGLEVRTADFL